MKIEYSEEAAADLAEATGWYGSSRIEGERLLVLAVVSLRMEPGYWIRRLK